MNVDLIAFRPDVIRAVDAELSKAIAKHTWERTPLGNMHDGERLGVLVEEVGETAKACIEGEDDLRIGAELIQVAAMALAWYQAITPEPAKVHRFDFEQRWDERITDDMRRAAGAIDARAELDPEPEYDWPGDAIEREREAGRERDEQRAQAVADRTVELIRNHEPGRSIIAEAHEAAAGEWAPPRYPPHVNRPGEPVPAAPADDCPPAGITRSAVMRWGGVTRERLQLTCEACEHVVTEWLPNEDGYLPHVAALYAEGAQAAAAHAGLDVNGERVSVGSTDHPEPVQAHVPPVPLWLIEALGMWNLAPAAVIGTGPFAGRTIDSSGRLGGAGVPL